MATLKEQTQDLTDYLATIDKKKLSMMDLSTYCGMMKALRELNTPTFEETMRKYNGISGLGYSPAPVKSKGDEDHG